MSDIPLETSPSAPSGADMPAVAVTGGAGWLGRRVVLALMGRSPDPAAPKLGVRRVKVLAQPGEDLADLADGAEVIRGDVRDPAALKTLLEGCEGGGLIHLAGVIHPPGRTRLFDEVNHQGTMNALDAAKAAGVKRAVVMSSNSPIGYNPAPEHRFTEDSPFAPYMGYGRSKMKMEQALSARFGGEGEPEITIVRAPWFYGPGQPPRQTLFFKLVKDGKFPVLGSGAQRRSMSYVDNLATGLLLALSVPAAANRVYWIADERPYPFAEIVETVREVLRDDFGMTVSEKTARLPGVLSDVARIVDAGLQGVGLYHQKVHVLSELNLTIACDVGRAKAELGYAPSIELREGMRRSVEWCLANGHDI